jgi:hypothetical protein
VRGQLKVPLAGLGIDGEMSEAIKTIQCGISTILDLLDVGGGLLELA